MSSPPLHLSGRVRRDLSLNPLAARLAALRASQASLLDLTVSNPTRCGLAYPEAEIREAFAQSDWMRYQPDPAGRPDAREAVAAYYAQRGMSVDPGRILLTASTSEAYAYLFKLLTEPGDQVLVPQPSYPLFDFLADLELCRLAPYRLVNDGDWSVDFPSLEDAATPRTRAVITVHPNNPTGSFLRPTEHRTLGQLCTRQGWTLIVDEVFADFGLTGTAPPLLPGPEGTLTVLLNGLSKILALPQLKLGWMVLDGPDDRVQSALEGLELIGDTFLSVGTPVQSALPRLLDLRSRIQEPLLQRLRTNLETLLNAVGESSPCSVLKPAGGWTVVVRVPGFQSSEDWALELLDRQSVYVHPGSFYGFSSEGFLVLSLLPDPDQFAEGVTRLVRHVSEQT